MEVYSALRIPKSAFRKVLLKIHFHGKLQKVEVGLSLEIV
jgi:hypothetical protein